MTSLQPSVCASVSTCLLLGLAMLSAAIQRKLSAALKPSRLVLVNESAAHAGHSGNPGGGADAETHFKLTVVSDAFAGKSLVARHRLVYAALSDEFAAGLHALSIEAKTSTE